MSIFNNKNKVEGGKNAITTVGGTVVNDSGNINPETGVGIGGTVAGGADVIGDVRRIAGFLVSFSRHPTGEYFPLYEGKNTIGADYMNSSIVLNEKSVSDEHAVITIKVKGDSIMAKIMDESSFGTFVDGVDIDEIQDVNRRLNNGSILNIGGYTLFVMIIDFAKVDTAQNQEFKEKY